MLEPSSRERVPYETPALGLYVVIGVFLLPPRREATPRSQLAINGNKRLVFSSPEIKGFELRPEAKSGMIDSNKYCSKLAWFCILNLGSIKRKRFVYMVKE